MNLLLRNLPILALLVAWMSICPSVSVAEEKPNFIVILTDDLGYGDFGCYGATDVKTPAIDRMAAEGLKLTSFYVSPVCSPKISPGPTLRLNATVLSSSCCWPSAGCWVR